MVSSGFKDQLVACIPSLRRFAVALARDGNLADDLVQETLLRAWEHSEQFEPGTNLRAWAFTILRNYFLTNYRRQKRYLNTDEELLESSTYQKPGQIGVIELNDFARALEGLPPCQHEALVLVAVSGFTVEEAAAICGVPVGTIKSRVSRARAKLQDHVFDDAGFIPPAMRAFPAGPAVRPY